MKVIIAGSRSIKDYQRVKSVIESSPFFGKITEVVSGKADGVDTLGEQWAKENGIPIKSFPVTNEDWEKYGKPLAARKRNNDMGEYADALILVWDGKSGGSRHMRKVMLDFDKPTYIDKL